MLHPLKFKYTPSHLEKIRAKSHRGNPILPDLFLLFTWFAGVVPGTAVLAYNLWNLDERRNALLAFAFGTAILVVFMFFPVQAVLDEVAGVPVSALVIFGLIISVGFYGHNTLPKKIMTHQVYGGGTRPGSILFVAGLLIVFCVNPFLYNFKFMPNLAAERAKSALSDSNLFKSDNLDAQVRQLRIIVRHEPNNIAANIMLARAEKDIAAKERDLEKFWKAGGRLEQWCMRAKMESRGAGTWTKNFCGVDALEDIGEGHTEKSWRAHHMQADKMLRDAQADAKRLSDQGLSKGVSPGEIYERLSKIVQKHNFLLSDTEFGLESESTADTVPLNMITLRLNFTGRTDELTPCLQEIFPIVEGNNLLTLIIKIDISRAASVYLELGSLSLSDIVSPTRLERLAQTHKRLMSDPQPANEDPRYFEFYDHYDDLTELQAACVSAKNYMKREIFSDGWKITEQALSPPAAMRSMRISWVTNYILAIDGVGGDRLALNEWSRQFNRRFSYLSTPTFQIPIKKTPIEGYPDAWRLIFNMDGAGT